MNRVDWNAACAKNNLHVAQALEEQRKNAEEKEAEKPEVPPPVTSSQTPHQERKEE